MKFKIGQDVAIDPSLDVTWPGYDMSNGVVIRRFSSLRQAISTAEPDLPAELQDEIYQAQIEGGLPGAEPWYELTPAGDLPQPRMVPESYIQEVVE